MERAVFEMEVEFARDPISVCILDQATRRSNLAIQVANDEKAVNAAFDVTHRNLFPHEVESRKQEGGLSQ